MKPKPKLAWAWVNLVEPRGIEPGIFEVKTIAALGEFDLRSSFHSSF